MKKLMFVLGMLFVTGTRIAFADSVSLADQINISLLDHVVGVTEFTSHGTTKVEFLDGLVQFGHYEGDYIFALDGGFSNSTAPDKNGHLATTWGVHAHVISLIRNLIHGPSILDYIDATPRYSYDTDVHHGVVGYMVGAVIPFGGQ